jgi:hypothetical protein
VKLAAWQPGSVKLAARQHEVSSLTTWQRKLGSLAARRLKLDIYELFLNCMYYIVKQSAFTIFSESARI